MAPFALAALAVTPRGRASLQHRVGFWKLVRKGPYVWFHGASAGELRGLVPVLKEWRVRFPEDRLLVTATTITGLEAIEGFADELRILPFDAVPFMRRALDSLSFRLFVATETELWPTLMKYLEDRRIPRCLINARISQRSFPKYLAVKRFVGSAINRFNWIAAGDEDSLERIRTLVDDPSRGELLGNTKFDVERGVASTEADSFWQSFSSDQKTTIVLGCVRPSEEEWWLRAVKNELSNGRRFRLVIAPRHREKFDYFADKLSECDLRCIRRSRDPYDTAASVILLDTFGELAIAYQGATLSFIGATLVPLGGHNPLEASAWGNFVAVGPSCDTYDSIVRALVAADAAAIVSSPEDVALLVRRAVEEPEETRRRGAGGIVVWQQQQGATARVVERLAQFRGEARDSR